MGEPLELPTIENPTNEGIHIYILIWDIINVRGMKLGALQKK